MKKINYILFSIILYFICLNNVNAATCVYNSPSSYQNKFTITCSSNTSNCQISTNYDISISPGASSLNIGNKCPSRIYITYTNNKYITSINASGTGDALLLDKNKSKEDTGSSGNEGTNIPSTNPSNPQKPSTSGDGFDADNFCQGTVQGVFTALGWLFFVVKIVIPILLIVFGSIDVGKAVIASKDDELKKSIKTLVVRVIAGVIIFFVPSILNLVVKMIDDNDVYNGTFWDCTKCMLEPNGNTCSSLGGNK